MGSLLPRKRGEASSPHPFVSCKGLQVLLSEPLLQDTSRLLKNSRRSRCQRHGPGCKAPRRRRCLAHRLGAATQQAGPCRGNPHFLLWLKGRKGLGAPCVVAAPRKGPHPAVVAAPSIWPPSLLRAAHASFSAAC